MRPEDAPLQQAIKTGSLPAAKTQLLHVVFCTSIGYIVAAVFVNGCFYVGNFFHYRVLALL